MSRPPNTWGILRWLIATDERLRCGFCRRSNEDLGRLLTDPGVAVCDDGLAHLSTTMAKLRPEWGAAPAERITTLGKMGHKELVGFGNGSVHHACAQMQREFWRGARFGPRGRHEQIPVSAGARRATPRDGDGGATSDWSTLTLGFERGPPLTL